MGTPKNGDQVEAAFGALAEAAAVMANPTETSVLRTRVRRRRAARAGVAGIAALAVLSTSGWLIQHAVGQEHQPPPADDSTAAVEATAEASASPPTGEITTEAVEETPAAPPEFDDLIGVAMDLPSFKAGSDLFDQTCPFDDAELADGRDDDGMDAGVVYLQEVVHTPMTEGGPERAVAFLGCRVAESLAFQAVLLGADGNGGWGVAAPLIAAELEGDAPYDIAADPDYGVLVGVASSAACCGTFEDDLDYRVERIRLDGDGLPVFERIEEGDLSASAITDLSIAVEAAPAGGEREWLVTVTVRNEGGRTSAPFDADACGEDLEADSGLMRCTAPGEAYTVRAPALEPGETFTVEWTVNVPPSDEWSDDTLGDGGPTLWVRVDPVVRGSDVLVRDDLTANNGDSHKFTE